MSKRLLLLVLPVLLCAASAFATEIPFTRVDIDTSLSGAAHALTADLDMDGDDDVVATAIFGDDLVWYENTAGDGTSWSSNAIDLDLDYAFGLDLADLDGDGDLDVLATAVRGDEVVWYENDLDGAATWPRSVIESIDDPWTVEAADLDGDGDLDVLMASDASSTLQWYENLVGDGSTWAINTIDSAFSGANWATAGDIDQDGTLDVLATAYDGDEVAWYANTAGDGSSWTKTTMGTSDGPFEADLVDLDADGDLDAVVSAYTDDELLWLENTDGVGGAWGSTVIDAAFDGAYLLETRDTDQDGDLDIVAAAFNGDETAWYENTGGSFTKRGLQTGFNGASGAMTDDLDGDGDIDVITAAIYDDDVVFMRNDSVHSSSQGFGKTSLNYGTSDARHTTVVDVDQDGDLDVLGGANSGLAWSENLFGDASAWQKTTIDASSQYWATGAADLDSDGDLDLIGGDKNNGELAWFVNGGSGSYTRAVIGSSLGITRDIDTADMDGDGDLDVVVTSSGTGRLLWFANDDGVGGSWTEAVVASRNGAFGVEIVDFDQDGDPDILCAWDSGDRVSWFANDGAGTFSETVLAIPDGPRWARAGDYDEDGDLDVLVAVARDGDVIILVNPGSAGGTFTTEVVDDTLTSGWFAEWADLDLDGDLDIAASASDQVNIYENTSAGWVKTTVDTGSNILHGDLGDLDGDGDLDVVAPHLSGTDGFFWYPNDRVHAESTATDISPSVNQPASSDVLVHQIDVTHLGRAGDSGIEPTTMAFAFDDASGAPLDQSTIELIVAQLDVLSDSNGDGVCNAGDASVGTLTSFPATAGVVTVPITSGQAAVGAEATVPWCSQITLTASPISAGMNEIVISHVPDAGDAFADAVAGIPLTSTGTGISATVIVNEPPVANPGGPYNGDEGVAISLDGSGSLDVDGVVVSYSWDCDGDGVEDATGSTVSCTFPDDGLYAVAMTVTDDLGTSSTANATVTVANLAPTLTVTPPAAVSEGGTQVWTAVASDVAADPLDVTWQVMDPSSVQYSSGTGSTATVTFPDDGTWTISFTVTDGDGGTTSDTQTTVVANAPPVPSIDSGPSTASEGSTVTFTGSAVDPGASDTFSLSWEMVDSTGAGVTNGNGASYSTVIPDDETYTVVLTATDDLGDFASVSASIAGVNVVPAFTSTPTTSLDEGVAWQYLPVVTEPGDDPLTFTLSSSAPATMTLDGTTGQLDWTPTYADVPSVSFTLSVDDGDGGTNSQSINLTIAFTDSEPDGMADTWEGANGLDPTVDDSAGDPDADGVSNLDEFLGGTDPQTYDGPDVPVATFPIGGEEVDDATPGLTWSNASDPQGDALTYDVELYDDASMSTLLDSTVGVAEDSSGSTSWSPSVAVTENATAWWRVRADDGSVAGGWTDLEEFFVNEINEAPTAPSPAAPLDGDSVDTLTPELSWVEGGDVDLDELTYDVRVWDDAASAIITETTGAAGTTWTVDVALTEDSTYAWDARSVDPDGLTSAWTTPQGFLVDTANSAPAAIAWVAPLDGDDLASVSPLLEVSASTDPEDEVLTYTFEIDTVSTFDGGDYDTADSADPTWDLDADGVALTENTSWFLRARVADARGAASDWATIEVFVRGDNDAPDAPVLIAPVDGTSQLTTVPSPTFVVAHAEDPEGDEVVYSIRVARDEALTDIIDQVSDLAPSAGSEGTADQTSWAPTDSLGAGDYFWSAAATDADGASTDADEVWAFTIEEPSIGDDDDDDDDTGCDCQSNLVDGGVPALWLLLLLLPALRRRR